MNLSRKLSVWVGLLFLVGTGAGILSGLATQPLLSGPDYLHAIAAHETRWIAGVLLILVMGLPLAMVPVVLFPLLKRHNAVLAIGAIVFRGALEAVAYLLLALCFLLLLTAARQAGADPAQTAGWQGLGVLLRAASAWVELLLAIVFSAGSILINLLLYQSRLVPRWLSGWGLVGSLAYFTAPLVCLLSPQHPAFAMEGLIGFLIGPLALEEMVFAVWLLAKGFNPSSGGLGHPQAAVYQGA